MTTVRALAEETPVAKTETRADEAMTDALLRATKRAHVRTEGDLLYDQLDADALDRLLAHKRSRPGSDGCTVVVRLWDRTYLVTSEYVEVYG